MHFRGFNARQQTFSLIIVLSVISACLTTILGYGDCIFLGTGQNSSGRLGWNDKFNNQAIFWLRHYISSVILCNSCTRQRRKRSERLILNRMQRSVYGNRSNVMMKIVSWNSGSSHLKNQMNEVQLVLQQTHPHVFFVSESNLWHSHNRDDVQIDGYDNIYFNIFRYYRSVCPKYSETN